MIACTIAGSDSGGGAGIQADLKTFQELGVFGTSAITALTAQNTVGVHAVLGIDAAFVTAQLEAILTDFDVRAIKTGMLYDATVIEAIVKTLQGTAKPLVVDPVMIAKGGQSLLQQEAMEALKTKLLPLATVCTPNIPEAEVLAGMTIESDAELLEAAQRILAYGVQCVVLKGGHLAGEDAIDYVVARGVAPWQMRTTRFATPHTHGTGCTFSAALTAQLAKGETLRDAIIEAKRFVDAAIKHPLGIGNGHGPTNHFAYNKLERRVQVDVF